MWCLKLLLKFILIAKIIVCDSNIITNSKNQENASESRLLFKDIGKWFETFLKGDECPSVCNSNNHTNHNSANGENITGSVDKKKPNKSCRNRDFMIIAKCITMKCIKTEIECKELWMADSCIDRPKAIDVENCIRDVRAEINRLEGPISGIGSFDLISSRRNRRFLFDELDDLFDIFYDDDDDDDSSEHVIKPTNPTNSADSSISENVGTTTTNKPQITEQTEPSIASYGAKKIMFDVMVLCKNKKTETDIATCVRRNCEIFKHGNDCIFNMLLSLCLTNLNCVYETMDKICDDLYGQNKAFCHSKYNLFPSNEESSSNFNECENERSDEKAAFCIKNKCMQQGKNRGDADCTYRGLVMICNGSTSLIDCVNEKYELVCDDKDIECRMKFGLPINHQLKFKFSLNEGNLRNIFQTCIDSFSMNTKKKNSNIMESSTNKPGYSVIKCVERYIGEVHFNIDKTCMEKLEYDNDIKITMEPKKFIDEALNCFQNNF